jgi:cytochrome c oxidase subunit 2
MSLLSDLGLLPVQASTMAPRVDALYLALVGLTAFFGILISALVIVFAVKYRRRSAHQIGAPIRGSVLLELTWTVIPTGIVLVIFVWSSAVFVAMAEAPSERMDVYVVGKQWMWKVQHTSGQREINALHVPVGRTIRLVLTSQDVIHDFFIPAFRVKTDVVPGKYTSLWFNATRPGRYHLFCAEYCGTDHSAMRGEVVVMPTREYEAWLARGSGDGSLSSAGRELFEDLECDSCHRIDSQGRGPMLVDLFGSTVLLDNGERVVVDESYLRQSILQPESQVAAGFRPLMPSFQGVVTEEEVLLLIEYIRSLHAGTGVQQPPIPPELGRERYAPSVPPGRPEAKRPEALR